MMAGEVLVGVLLSGPHLLLLFSPLFPPLGPSVLEPNLMKINK